MVRKVEQVRRADSGMNFYKVLFHGAMIPGSLLLATAVVLSSTLADESTSPETISTTTAASEAAAKITAANTELPPRAAWTTSRISGSPEPPHPYITETAFPGLKFDRCLDLVAMPESDRMFVVEQSGRICSFVNQPDVTAFDVAVDLSKEISGVEQTYALAFHPDFMKNRYCYICYIKAADLEDGTQVSRFVVTDSDPPTIDVASETPLLTWRSGGHNGCSLKFGPDGYLYISTGDAGPANPPDPLKAGQDLTNLLSAILRINVDQPSDNRNYSIPPDNPFVELPEARGEIWAYGLRNPWRMSFDPQTGDLWVGDVGWELWELLYRVERGGNYGWSVMEGRQPTNPEWPRGPTPILPPTIDHPHSESSSITDGLTYYGSRLPELHGMHIYSDYDTGKFWAFRYRDGQIVDHQEIADTTHRVVGFGEDHAGEMYLLDHTAGTIHRLIPNPQVDQNGSFPRKLSESGLFASLSEHIPADGVVPYKIKAEQWADNSVSERFVAVPGTESIDTKGDSWKFPADSVLVRTLSLELTAGNTASRKRVETQILHFDGLEWYPYTYAWNDEQTDAELVPDAGAERVFEIADPTAPGGRRRQEWRFAGRAECQRCHNRWSGPPLAFNTAQLNTQDSCYGGTASQLDAFASIRLFENPVPEQKRKTLADPHDSSADLDQRARAYLHANCAHCHRMHAGSAVLSKMPFDVPLEETDMVDVRPTQGTFGIHSARVIAPGDPFGSILFYRMAKLGNGRMPHIGSSETDLAGLRLISEWIHQIPASEPDAADDASAAKAIREQERTLMTELSSAQDTAAAAELVGRMLSTTSGALMLLDSVDQGTLPAALTAVVIEMAAAHEQAAVRDLFERFLPEEQRVRRLGSVISPEQILSLAGDAARGREVFFATAGVQCRSCHRIGEMGIEVGPDLTTIGRKNDHAQLLESLLEPSKRIDPKYVTHLVETEEGRLYSGLLVSRDETEVVLRTAQNQLVRVAVDNVAQLVPQQQSLMPDLLLRDMTAQQAADLLEFLSSLK